MFDPPDRAHTAVGKRVRCPNCQAAVPVPADDFEVVDEPKPVKKKPVVVEDEDEPPRKKKRPRVEDEDEGDEPRQGVSLTRNIIMGVVLLVLASVAGYIFYTKMKPPADDTDPPVTAPAKR